MAVSTNNPFSIISRNLQFEAENPQNNQQNSQQNNNNVNNDSQSLDDELDNVREEKKEAQGEENNNNQGDADAGGTDAMDTGNQDSEVGGDADPTNQNTSDTPGDEPKLSPTGVANRKLTFYTEFNRILAVIRGSVDALENIDSTHAEIKSCVAQLQKIYEDGKLVVSKFEDYSESDIMIQLEMLKERSSLILELLERLQKEKTQTN